MNIYNFKKMQMQGGMKMLELLTNVFTRDKGGFSFKELKRQKEFCRMAIKISLILEIITIFFITILYYNRKDNDSTEIFISARSIVIVIINFIILEFFKLEGNCEKELEKIKKKRRVLKVIERDEQSKLRIIDDEIIQMLFQKALKCNIIEIRRTAGGINLLIDNEDPIFISNEDILETFLEEEDWIVYAYWENVK